MDILAAIFVYLIGLAGIFGALAVSFMLYFFPPHRETTPATQTVAAVIVQQSTPKTASMLKSASAAQPANGQAPRTAAQSIRAQPRPSIAASPAQVQAMRAQYLRRLVQEQRAKRWAYGQDSSFENRFMSYAD